MIKWALVVVHVAAASPYGANEGTPDTPVYHTFFYQQHMQCEASRVDLIEDLREQKRFPLVAECLPIVRTWKRHKPSP